MAKQIKCFFCKVDVPRADARAKSVLCSTCVSKLVGSPQAIGKAPKQVKINPEVRELRVVTPKAKKVKVVSKATGFGRGWHLKKKFVAPDGTVYSFGQKV